MTKFGIGKAYFHEYQADRIVSNCPIPQKNIIEFLFKPVIQYADKFRVEKSTLETSGKDLKSTLETSGKVLKSTLETSGKDLKSFFETSGNYVITTLETSVKQGSVDSCSRALHMYFDKYGPKVRS